MKQLPYSRPVVLWLVSDQGPLPQASWAVAGRPDGCGCAGSLLDPGWWYSPSRFQRLRRRCSGTPQAMAHLYCWSGPSVAGRRECPRPGARGKWHRFGASGGDGAYRARPPRSRPPRPGCAAPEPRSDHRGSGCPQIGKQVRGRREPWPHFVEVLAERRLERAGNGDHARFASLSDK